MKERWHVYLSELISKSVRRLNNVEVRVAEKNDNQQDVKEEDKKEWVMKGDMLN